MTRDLVESRTNMIRTDATLAPRRRGRPMIHHVNLGLKPEQLEAELDFLVQVVGVRPSRAELGAPRPRCDLAAIPCRPVQIHLSLDPDHRPAMKSQVAVELGIDLDLALEALHTRSIATEVKTRPDGGCVILCADSAGNRWEIRH